MSFDLHKSDRLEYGQIILSHIDRILKLSLVDISNSGIAGRDKSAVLSLGDTLTGSVDARMRTAEEEFERKRQNEVSIVCAYSIYFRE